MKALIYARVSSKDQEQEGFSIPSQLKLLKDYALKNNFQVAKEFVDVETAKKAGRGDFNLMINFAKSENIKTILCEKTDRLTRNYCDTATIDDLMTKFDIKIHLVKENTILEKNSKSHEKFIFGIKALISKNYIDNLSEESRKGMKEKAEQGYYPSLAPLGYKNVALQESNGKKKVLRVDKQKAPIIRKMFELYATGNYSLGSLVDFAYKQGLRNRNGGKVHKSAIHKMLNFPLYYGDFVWGGKTIKGRHEPIISRRLFNDVQEAFEALNRPKQTKRQFTFSGLMNCGDCGCSVTAEIKKHRFIYYHCTNSKRLHKKITWIPERKLPDMFGEPIKKAILKDDVFDWLRLLWKERGKDKMKYHENRLQLLNNEKTKIENQLSRLYDLLIAEKIPEDIFNSKKESLDRNFASLSEEIENANPLTPQKYDEGFQTLELLKNLYPQYVTSNLEKKVKIIKRVSSNYSLNDVSLSATYRKPFDICAKGLSRSKKLPREDSNLGQAG